MSNRAASGQDTPIKQMKAPCGSARRAWLVWFPSVSAVQNIPIVVLGISSADESEMTEKVWLKHAETIKFCPHSCAAPIKYILIYCI